MISKNFSLFCLELDIGFDSSTYEVVENERFVNVTIVLDGRTSRDILITLSTRDGSAICECYVYCLCVSVCPRLW